MRVIECERPSTPCPEQLQPRPLEVQHIPRRAGMASVMLMFAMMIMRLVRVRTGPVSGLSTAGFSRVTAANLIVTQLYPVVAQH